MVLKYIRFLLWPYWQLVLQSPLMLAEQFEHLKKLCRIDCTPEEESEIRKALEQLIEYFEEMKQVDTTNVPACNYVLQSMLKNRMREDVCKDLLSREIFLTNAPDQIGGMVRTPPILKE